MKSRSLPAFCCLFSSATVWAASGPAGPPLTQKDLPRVPPVEATNALKTFQIKRGFHLQLVAAEPLVMDPIAMCFDENGRLFVIEMRDYSEMREVHPHLGRIRMLEDTNGDGIFDKATIFADDLPWPTGLIWCNGGLYVAASPEILYFKDTKGKGVADVRKVIFTGFGAGMGDKLNVQALLNSLTWGLDNRIHGQTASNGGKVAPADQPNAKPLNLNGRDFYFDPRTMVMEAETGGGQYGMCFDDRGRRFVCSNSHHIQTFMYDAYYGERNRFYNMPPALVDIPVDGPAAEVYRISPEEQWRVIRTKWRVTGVVPGLIEGGGRASGYFTSATGITIFRGNNWPKENLGDAFVADCGSNLVHRKKIRPDGVGLLAERPPDEEKVEFLASTDIWFRPVQLANAPDGTLYIADMYREVIEHPWSLPESIKKLLDLNAGNDRGRIYRVVPDGFKQPKLPRLGRASTKELVATLEHPNGWHRDTAARLLYERQDPAAVPLLLNLLSKSPSALARMHALYALDGSAALKEAQVLTSLNDADPSVREHAIRLSEKFKSTASDMFWARVRQLANDPVNTVRYQLALTLGEFNRPGRVGALATIAARDIDSSWTRAAVLSSLSDGAGEMFSLLAANTSVCNSKPGQDFLRELVNLVGAMNQPAELGHVREFIDEVNEPGLRFALVRALGEGLHRVGSALDREGRVGDVFSSAARTAPDARAEESVRVQAIQLLGLTSYAESGAPLLSLLDLQQPQAVQLAAIATLSRFTDPQVGPELTKRWGALTPRLRSEALAALLARADRARALLEAIAAGTIQPSVLDSMQTKFLLNHRNSEVQELAAKTLAARPASTRQQVIDSFMPALNLKGEPARGKKIYEERCISCHRLGGQGFALGPDLVTVKNTGKEKMLVNILDPNREVRPDFASYLIETKDEESYIGLVVNETGTAVTLRQAYGKEDVIRRANIRKMQSSSQSLMPEGLEVGLAPQDLADLLEYIESAEAR
jgi:putative membrane-bound dehydrogenase-like protein